MGLVYTVNNGLVRGWCDTQATTVCYHTAAIAIGSCPRGQIQQRSHNVLWLPCTLGRDLFHWERAFFCWILVFDQGSSEVRWKY